MSGHDHARGDRHDHTHPGAANERRVAWAFLLTAGFMGVEAAGGIISGSLALLTDAGHMLTDAAALAISWYAFRASRRPATLQRTYGHDRLQVLAALVNGGVLLGITAWIVIEAIMRLSEPVEVTADIMLIVAALGLATNIIAFVILNGGSRENLNIRGAVLHVASDLLGSVAAIVAAAVILLTGWMPIDPILSLLVALLILRSVWSLLRQSWHVLMEGAPEGLDLDLLQQALVQAVPGVRDVHHVHAWSLTPERTLVTLHATVEDDADHDAVLHQMQDVLADQFHIGHATIQLERRHSGPSLPGGVFAECQQPYGTGP
ncbi:MAG TPA: cation diffusion facilitator family transporter [Geminicoccus sp.]|jgi:cobalt-zinc-cadmium efflux system protein|uniref:cation diffusion facilitator family transporter n=1 Tax=Geminicoccus sp. TaxID=2024832 RepID=UPI002E34E86A|nr:cation diffusion facilitator family transporter [Geminicoccus sp.]HEX2524781.1 cation diffusion facilitator family transporter [Geminicoccus sp.]